MILKFIINQINKKAIKRNPDNLLSNLFWLAIFIVAIFVIFIDFIINFAAWIFIHIYILTNAEIIKKEQITNNKQVIELKKSIDNYFK